MPATAPLLRAILLTMLAVECVKCGRAGRYRVSTIAERIGADGKLTDWLYDLTAACPLRQSPGFADRCAACCPELPALFAR
jgi:hypothetical protein